MLKSKRQLRGVQIERQIVAVAGIAIEVCSNAAQNISVKVRTVVCVNVQESHLLLNSVALAPPPHPPQASTFTFRHPFSMSFQSPTIWVVMRFSACCILITINIKLVVIIPVCRFGCYVAFVGSQAIKILILIILVSVLKYLFMIKLLISVLRRRSHYVTSLIQ